MGCLVPDSQRQNFSTPLKDPVTNCIYSEVELNRVKSRQFETRKAHLHVGRHLHIECSISK